MYKYVDLGAKHAGAMGEARKHGPSKGLPEAQPPECLAVDRDATHKESLGKAGYQVKIEDVEKYFCWPEARVYLAWNFLEHLSNLESAQRVLQRMFEQSREAVWLLLPSFEDTTLDRLRSLGYTLPWVDWRCHRTHFQLRHAAEVAALFKSRIRDTEYREKWLFRSCKGLKPLDGRNQSSGLLDPPVIGAYEIIYYLESR